MPLLAFSLGIVLARSFDLHEGVVIIAFFLSFIVSAVGTVKKWRWSGPFLLIPACILGTMFFHGSMARQLPDNHVRNLLDGDHGPPGMRIEGRLYRSPERSKSTTRLFVRAQRVISSGARRDVSGKVMLTVDSPDVPLAYGDRVRFLSRLTVPKPSGNAGEFNYSGYLAGKGIYVTGSIESEKWLVKLSEGGWLFWRKVESLRGAVREFIDGEDLRHGPLLKALLIGERGEVGREERDRFVRTGTAHLLAISGLHIGIIASLVYLLIYRLLRCSELLMLAANIRKVALLSVVPPVLIYALLAGLALPTQRAVIMILAFVIAILIDRARNLYNALALAAFIILVISPTALFSVSFQLSFAAVLSIVYMMPRLRSIIEGDGDTLSLSEAKSTLRRRGEKVVAFSLVSLSAAFGTAPLVAYHFNSVSLIGGVTNLIVIPLVSFFVVPLGLVALLLLPLWHGAASLVIHGADYGLIVTMRIIGLFSRLPFAALWTTGLSVAALSVMLVLLVFALSRRGRRKARIIVPAALLILLLPWVWNSWGNRWRRDLTVTFLSVGQGDAALIEFPYGRRMLIDGGARYEPDYDAGRMIVAPFLRKRGVGTIDYLVLSHAQTDHRGGLDYIADNFTIGEFWWNGDRSLGTLGALLREHSVPMVERGAHSLPMEVNGVTVEILHPPPGVHFSANNGSLTLRLTYGKVKILFPGDVEGDGEKEIVLRNRGLKVNVLKVPHHGSRTSSSALFLNAVQPTVAIFSVGRNNPFGFPHPEVVERYRAAGTVTFRTDRDGAVEVVTDGETIRVEGYRHQRPSLFTLPPRDRTHLPENHNNN